MKRQKDNMVIIPAFNEAKNIGKTIDLIRATKVPVKILVIDDGSKDKTSEIAKAKGVEVITLPENKGKAYAVMYGMKVLNKRNPATVLTMDADMSKIEPFGLRKMIEVAEKNSGKDRPFMATFVVIEGNHSIFVDISGIRSFNKEAVEKLANLKLSRFETKVVGFGLEPFLNNYFTQVLRRAIVQRIHVPGAFHAKKAWKTRKLFGRQLEDFGTTGSYTTKLLRGLRKRGRRNRATPKLRFIQP